MQIGFLYTHTTDHGACYLLVVSTCWFAFHCRCEFALHYNI